MCGKRLVRTCVPERIEVHRHTQEAKVVQDTRQSHTRGLAVDRKGGLMRMNLGTWEKRGIRHTPGAGREEERKEEKEKKRGRE